MSGTIAIMPERLVGHHRAQIRAADADIDQVLDRLAGVPFPGSAADLWRSLPLIEHGVDLGDDILAIDDDGLASGARSATCKTARPSVTLIFSPRNIASMRAFSADSSASCKRSSSVSSVIRFLE